MKKIWTSFKVWWLNFTGKLKTTYLKAAINVVNAFKSVSDAGVIDWLVILANNKVASSTWAVIKPKLDSVLITLKLADSIPTNATQEQYMALLKSALATLNLNYTVKAGILTNMAAMLIVALSDGKLSLTEAWGLAEYAYENRVNL